MLAALAAKFFLGGGLTAITGALGDAYARKLAANTSEAKLAADVEISNLEAKRDVLLAEQGWWVTAWIRPLFAYPVIVHFGLVVADSIFQFSWTIAALPSPMDQWEGWIVGAYFLTRPVEKVGKAMAMRRR